jgi:hypothetical protein
MATVVFCQPLPCKALARHRARVPRTARTQRRLAFAAVGDDMVGAVKVGALERAAIVVRHGHEAGRVRLGRAHGPLERAALLAHAIHHPVERGRWQGGHDSTPRRVTTPALMQRGAVPFRPLSATRRVKRSVGSILPTRTWQSKLWWPGLLVVPGLSRCGKQRACRLYTVCVVHGHACVLPVCVQGLKLVIGEEQGHHEWACDRQRTRVPRPAQRQHRRHTR